MIISGLELPQLLTKLVLSGKWKVPEDRSALALFFPDKNLDRLLFLGFEEMQRSIIISYDLAKDLGDVYSLYSSASGHDPNPEMIDVDQSISIIETDEEDVICLDYRKTPPTVHMSVFLNNIVIWKMIASDFDEFVDIIGIK